MKHNYWIALLAMTTTLFVGCGGSTPDGGNTDNISVTPVNRNYVFNQVLYENGFEDPIDEDHVPNIAKLGTNSFRLTSDRKYSMSYQKTAQVMGLKPGDQLQVRAFLYRAPEHTEIEDMGSLVVSQTRNGEGVQWKGLGISQYLQATNQNAINNWVEVLHVINFEDVQDIDSISVYIWNESGQPIHIDNWQIEHWRDQSEVADLNSTPDGYVFSSLLYENGFEDPNDINTVTGPVFKGERAYRLIPQVEYTSGLTSTLGEIGAQPGDYIKTSVSCLRQEGYLNPKSVSSLVVSLDGTADNVSVWQGRPLETYLRDDNGRTVDVWKELSEWVLVPEGAKPEHKLSIYVWKPRENGQGSIILDDLKVELWKKGNPQ